MDLSARTIYRSARQGFERLSNYRKNRLLFIESYVGQYYNKDHGFIGQEPLNMSFNAIRVLVPNLVTRNPKPVVTTDFLPYRPYADLLALSLAGLSKRLKLPATMQRGIVDAIFTLGIFKTGLASSDTLVYFGDEGVDPGQLYVGIVDFDNFTFDPTARYLETASLVGERIRVERDHLMDSDLYDNDVIKRLPSAADTIIGNTREVRNLSAGSVQERMLAKLHDYVDLVELFLPGPNVLVTVPFDGPVLDHFLREESYYGPESGPYTYLSLTPEVPNNPIPVQLAGIWQDLHAITNRMAKKAMDQAEAQKDILGYQKALADDAQEIVDAKNLDAVGMEDPSSAQMFSFGGQNPANGQFIAQLEMWFNQMSGNTNLTGGIGTDANTATEVNVLNQNAATGATYMRDKVYGAGTEILRNLAWYVHVDPLWQQPLVRREVIPARYDMTDQGLRMIQAPQEQLIQVFLTPEVRRGDFLDFAFDIESESMAPINWQFRLQQLEVLAIKIIPAAAQAAQISMAMGVPFSFQRFVTRVAKLMNIEWMDEIFQDPETANQMAMMMQAGPQMQNSKGVASMAAINQNNGSAVAKVTPSQRTQQRQGAQAGANQAQGDLPVHSGLGV